MFYKYCIYLAKDRDVKYLGTPYGGWYFSDKNLTNQIVIISAGVGEDISFDIEMLNNYQAKLYLVDPTPRAILYIQKIIDKLGNGRTVPYDESTGNQPIEAYNLSNVKLDDFILIKKACIINRDKQLNFTHPPIKNM